jgi:3-oxoacyl-[acyl-carrier protein] reductase
VRNIDVKTLDGKVALVSGSGRGIGKAIALKLAASGAHVVVNDLDADVAAATAAEIEALGVRAALCVGDVTDAQFGQLFIDTAMDAFGTIDIIINNAGYAWDATVQKTSDEQWAAMLDVHLTAPFRILRAAQPVIATAAKREIAELGRAKRRTIINISSVAGLGGNAGQAGYAAGKAGIVGLTRTLMKEWGRYNVTVNAVAFGAIMTRMTAGEPGSSTISIKGRDIKAGVSDEILEAMEKGIPLGRAGTPEEAAGAVYLLCLPEADYITGEVIVAGGGWKL